MKIMLITGFLIVAGLIGLIALQIYLSMKKSKLPGLVMPVIAFIFGLIFPFIFLTFPSGEITLGYLGNWFVLWVVGNVPTIILLIIYFGWRGGAKRKKWQDD